jgi:uncharacterized protein YpmB
MPQIIVFITPEDDIKIKSRAKKENISKADIINKIIREGLNDRNN